LLLGYNAATGHLDWWHSWYDDNLDTATAYPGNGAAGTTSSGKPRNMKEMAIFGDHISHAISVIDGIVYSLEGFPDAQTTMDRFRRGSTVKYGVTTNRLAAFEPRGKSDADGNAVTHEGGLRWHRGGDRDPETGQEVPVVFCAAPVPFGPRLIVPVRDAGSLWLYAIEPKQVDGTWEAPTIWKTLLCDEPPGGVNPFATVGVAVRGSDVYVGSGAGVVFAVDGATGVIRWATRYKRTGVSGVTGINQFRQITRGTNIEGFDVDTVIPFEGKLVVLPSDSKHIFTVDRRTGEPVNYAPGSSDCRHVLGTAGRWLILGGPNEILCFDMKTGRRRWNWPREKAVAILGRGCVTTEGVFVPIDDTVVQLSLPKLEFLGSRHVAEAGNAPLGNLYSNGERLFALGIDRVLALGSIEQLIVQLDKEIDKQVDPQGDLPAQQAAQMAARSERMRLQAKLNNTDAAIADLTVLVAAADARQPGEAAGLKLLVGKIGEMDLAAKAGLDSFELLMNTSGDLSRLGPDGRKERLAIIETALHGIGKNEKSDAKQHQRAISLILRLIAQDPQRHLLVSAQGALKSAVRPEDAGVLKEALASESVSLRLSAIVPLVSLEGAKAADPLAVALADKIARVRIEAAHGLAEIGDRRALGAFVDLLSSDDVILRGQALSALRSVSGQRFGLLAGAKPEARTKGIEKWRQWVEKDGDKAKLDRSRKAIPVDWGRLLVAVQGRGGLIEFDSEGTQTFSADDIHVASACLGLPDGHRLVASRSDSLIFKFADADRPIWVASVPRSPVSIEQLRNEHILVACASQVVEVDPNGKNIPVPTPKGTFLDARRVGEGLTLLAMIADGKGQVVEVDREGRVVREIAKAIKPVAVRRLPNGNTLVVDEEAADDGPQVVEYDGQGKIVWQQSGLLSPHDVQRLPNGNTLVVDNNGIKEFDPAGKVVWKKDKKMVRSAYRY
ncbi:MAG: PQQ-binding-like beta-propeller repeat protein, partial [Planctomycetes bacterium]|nr:PQQ-binding-like beta-propeller repeat protein [Planctomycetota bacterium]